MSLIRSPVSGDDVYATELCIIPFMADAVCPAASVVSLFGLRLRPGGLRGRQLCGKICAVAFGGCRVSPGRFRDIRAGEGIFSRSLP
jgi:hypothetical protein